MENYSIFIVFTNRIFLTPLEMNIQIYEFPMVEEKDLYMQYVSEITKELGSCKSIHIEAIQEELRTLY